MAAILEKKFTKKDSNKDILKAIIKLSSSKLGRLMLEDDNEWKQQRLDEITRLANIVKNRV